MVEDYMEINIVVGHVDETSNDTDRDVCKAIEVNIFLSSDQPRASHIFDYIKQS